MPTATVTWKPDTCDCRVVQSFDDAVLPENRVFSYAGHIASCAAHAGIADGQARYNQMQADNSAKNLVERGLHALSTVVDTKPDGAKVYKSGVEYRWVFSGVDLNRTLTVTLVGVTLTVAQKAGIQTLINQVAPGLNVTVVFA